MLFAASMKVLLATALVSALLCAPALADPPQPQPAPTVAISNVNLRFVINDGTGVRRLGLILTDRSCGSIQNKSSSNEDEIKACSYFEGADAVRVEVDWRTVSGSNEVRDKSVLVMHRGQTQQLDGGRAKLDVTTVWPAT